MYVMKLSFRLMIVIDGYGPSEFFFWNFGLILWILSV